MIKRWLLSFLLTLLGLVNLLRAGLSYRLKSLFTQTNLTIYPFLGIFYGLAGVVFIGLAIICFRRRRNCPALLTILAYHAITWTVRIATSDSTYARSIWARDAVFTLFFLSIIFFLSWHPHNRKN